MVVAAERVVVPGKIVKGLGAASGAIRCLRDVHTGKPLSGTSSPQVPSIGPPWETLSLALDTRAIRLPGTGGAPFMQKWRVAWHVGARLFASGV